MEHRRIVGLVWPVIMEMIICMLLDIVDVAFVGRLGAFPATIYCDFW
jgi:Na+-driven multidrug efflux pump